jgi:hypothetical protein
MAVQQEVRHQNVLCKWLKIGDEEASFWQPLFVNEAKTWNGKTSKVFNVQKNL